MTATNFQLTTGWLLVHEGGFVNHPKDPGGATNKGVTQRTYNGYRKRRGVTKQSVRSITDAEVIEIYKSQYWDVIKGDYLPSGLDYAIYDFAVNSGPKRAAKFVQRLLGVNADGIIGNQTLGALSGFSPEDMRELIEALCNERLAWMKTLKTWDTFGKGWSRRVVGEIDGVQDTDSGVIDRAVRLHMGAHTHAPTMPAQGKAVEADRKTGTKIVDGINVETIGKIGAGAVPGAILTAVQQQGPMQWALAAFVIVATILGAITFYKKVLTPQPD